MARIEHCSSKRQLYLPARCLFGRSEACLERLEGADISREHASFCYQNSQWVLRDLGSRNGTFLAERRLQSGIAEPLVEGSEIRFGRNSNWRVLDVAAPAIVAVDLTSNLHHRGDWHHLVVATDDDSPLFSVFRDASGRWVAESSDDVKPLVHGMVIAGGQRAFRVFLPEGVAETAQITTESLRLRVGLRFRVAADEEHVELSVVDGTSVTQLPTRAHQYLLLTLARLRIADGQHEPITPASVGWVHVERLATLLGTDRNHVNVSIHRLRRQLVEHHLGHLSCLIERRPQSGELRLAEVPVSIERL